ncbi:hypothetical protein WN66_02013 [Saccharomyces cerevisiae]|uniref:Putative uncharacterized protein YFL031C-A n=1 Tax=Saccharomyces cerevisiae (strain ATCC 204508 / S288c) TaxID=559292 RepID=YF030_YEAST|nr:RecName: Full=Putative uncharacterized protein YFL031C-A [Saccharomyces cerevisiae S288C]AAL79205.1 unknown [Saccharomyces cerevisiae]KZV11569.1 hypothetical protein WN66_02013 [Saccharomyces cerevisiae]WNV72229.1 hypothetical protein O6U65_0975 [Saccharomyces cerevisiae synthetic construct]
MNSNLTALRTVQASRPFLSNKKRMALFVQEKLA